MSTTTRPHPTWTRGNAALIGSLSLIAGGITFVAGGATHPKDSGHGNKIDQLHDMLVDATWFPSHLLLVASLGLFAVGVLALRQRSDLDAAMVRVVRVVSIIAILATAGMTVHLLEAVNADSLADGEANFYSWLQTANEILVDATWGLAMAVLAVVGGRTRALGNRVTLVLGLVGGTCFALASATIPFTDVFDGLFPVASVLGLWAVVVGVLQLRHGPSRSVRPASV
jgi:hypothetical protein